MLIGHNIPVNLQRHGRCQDGKLSVPDLAVADGPGKYEWRAIWPSFHSPTFATTVPKKCQIQLASNWNFLLGCVIVLFGVLRTSTSLFPSAQVA